MDGFQSLPISAVSFLRQDHLLLPVLWPGQAMPCALDTSCSRVIHVSSQQSASLLGPLDTSPAIKHGCVYLFSVIHSSGVRSLIGSYLVLCICLRAQGLCQDHLTWPFVASSLSGAERLSSC